MPDQRRGLWTASAFAIALATASLGAEAQTLRTNILADPAMVDPITFSELVAGDILGNVYEGFTAIDENGDVVPALAESWDAHDDNLGFTFHLRPGVKFHSGRDFTANDVKYTFEQLLLPGNSSCSNVYLTSSAVNGRPEWNFTPSRSLKVKPRLSSCACQLSARAGLMAPFSSIAVKPS